MSNLSQIDIEKVYTVGKRGDFIIIGMPFVLAGAVFACVGALFTAAGLVGEIGAWLFGSGHWEASSKALATGLIPLVVGGAAGFVGWQHLGVLPYRLRLTSIETFEAIRVLRRTTVRISDISAIEKANARVMVEDSDPRQIRIHHVRGSVGVGYFDEIEQFLAEMLARNPTMEVRGEW